MRTGTWLICLLQYPQCLIDSSVHSGAQSTFAKWIKNQQTKSIILQWLVDMYYIRQPEAKRNKPPEVKEVNETKTSNLSSEEISVLGVVLRVTSIATKANITEKSMCCTKHIRCFSYIFSLSPSENPLQEALVTSSFFNPETEAQKG